MKFIAIFLICTITLSSYCQTWPKIYGDSYESNLKGIIEHYDKGYLLAGNLNTNRFIWIIKTDINGEIIWDKKIGWSSYRSFLYSLSTTNDNGYILAGNTKKYEPTSEGDPTFFKLNECSELEWCKTLQSAGDNVASGIIQNDDGTYIGMLKYYGGDITTVRISLVKMDSFGEPQWIKHLAQEDSLIYNEEGSYLYNVKSGEHLISGRCYYPGMQPFWILTDTSGEQIWDLMGGHSGLAHQVVEIDTGTFYSTSFYSDNGRPVSPVLFKFNEDGSFLNKYYLTADTIEKGSCTGISQFSDTSLIIGFCWEELPVPNNGYCEIAMTDTTGLFIKRKILLNTYRSPKHILKTYDGKILVGEDFVTDNNWDIYMWKLNSDLELDSLYTKPLTYDSLCPYPITSDTIDYECDLFVNIEELPTQEEYEQTLKVFPNPASEYVVLDLKEKETNRNCVIQIFNAIGTKQEERRVTPGSLNVTINIQNYPPGPYIAVLRNDERIISKGKFVVAR